MRVRFAAALVLCLALLLAAPATAQDAERVTITFRLTLRGEVLDWEEFRMVFSKSNQLPPGEFRFCGKASAFEPDLRPCEGGGTGVHRDCYRAHGRSRHRGQLQL